MDDQSQKSSRGRPKRPKKEHTPKACDYPLGCEKQAAAGQRFCSRAHSPYGFYGLDERGNELAEFR